MRPNKLFTTAVFVAVAAMGAAPAFAQSRDRDRGRHESTQAAGRAAPRESARSAEQSRSVAGPVAQREVARSFDRGSVGVVPSNAGGHVVGRAVPRTVYAPVYAPRYAPHYYAPHYYAPRFVTPHVIGVVPYRPYVYHPTFSPGFSYVTPYGYNYPYAYPAPPGYITPVPGRPYGGVRIVDAPRDAAVYADGYYVGVVDDFDGVFQHMNLEAGPHRIEIQAQGYPPAVFEVNVQPGVTITYRADIGRS